MGLFDSIGNTLKLLSPTNVETDTKKTARAQLGLLNTNFDAEIPINTNVDARTSADNRVYSDARQYQYTNAPQISLIYDSPNSTLTSKKSDKVSASNEPSVDSRPSTTGADVPVSIPVSLSPKLGGGSSTLLLLIGVGVGGYFLLKGGKEAKK